MYFKLFIITVSMLFFYSCDDGFEIVEKESPASIFDDRDIDGPEHSSHDGDFSEEGKCPDDMAAIGKICVDKYEASRSDATESFQGVKEDIAVSRPTVIPWYVYPLSGDDVAIFSKACENAGKRLCKAFEWFDVCRGPLKNKYSFGNEFDRRVCNSVDTFCTEYCSEHNIAESECNVSKNCGYNCGYDLSAVQCFTILPSGSIPECKNEFEVFDINGNIWEAVLSGTDSRGFEVRGGAFNCAEAEDRLRCSFNASWESLYAGFRCCRDLF